MRLVSTLALAVTMTGATLAQTSPPRGPIVPPLSSLLTHSPLTACAGKTATNQRVRIASWNIKAARAAPLDALTSEMHSMQADVIALQEVDVRTRRSGDVDQPRALAAALGFQYAFAASIRWDGGDYGLALLSKWPLVQVERHRVGAIDVDEPRIVLDVTICVAGRALRVLNHHADDQPAVRALGFVDVERIIKGDIGRGILLVGDMNEGATGPGMRALRDNGMVDLGALEGVSTADGGRIDYVLADEPLSHGVSSMRVWRTDKSDHHALLIDLQW